MECVNCGDCVENGVIYDREAWCLPCSAPAGEPGFDELDDPSRVAVRDRTGCVVITDPHMALLISECS